jgi:hypothetical protein
MMSMKQGTKMQAVPMPWTMSPSTHIQRVLETETRSDTRLAVLGITDTVFSIMAYYSVGRFQYRSIEHLQTHFPGCLLHC